MGKSWLSTRRVRDLYSPHAQGPLLGSTRGCESREESVWQLYSSKRHCNSSACTCTCRSFLTLGAWEQINVPQSYKYALHHVQNNYAKIYAKWCLLFLCWGCVLSPCLLCATCVLAATLPLLLLPLPLLLLLLHWCVPGLV